MPTYEYRCRNGHGFEEFFLKISDAKSELACPTCGERGLRHMSAGGGLLFKGSGFYITDYGKDGKKSAAVPRSESSSADGAKSAAKSDGAGSPGSPGTSGTSGSESAKSGGDGSAKSGGAGAPASSPKSGSE